MKTLEELFNYLIENKYKTVINSEEDFNTQEINVRISIRQQGKSKFGLVLNLHKGLNYSKWLISSLNECIFLSKEEV